MGYRHDGGGKVCQKMGAGMEKLFVTGASGFLGSRIAKYYNGKYEVCAPAHGEVDITDEKGVTLALEQVMPDVVVHCAAISDVGLCEKQPERSWRINVDGSVNIAKASKGIGAKCILCSSDQVYFGQPAPSFYTARKEGEALGPFPVYGQQKLKAEQECLRVNPDCVMLRLSWMYGLEAEREGEHGDFFRVLLQQLKAGDTIKAPVYDKRGITPVYEVVKNLEKTFAIPGGAYNFGSPNEKSHYDTVYEVFKNVGLDTGRLEKNEGAFCQNPRNISMCQEKINRYNIFFSPTGEALSRDLSIEGIVR